MNEEGQAVNPNKAISTRLIRIAFVEVNGEEHFAGAPH
jgi:hypothetical protein